MDTSTTPIPETTDRESSWAKPVGKLKVEGLPEEALPLNVEGRQLTGPLQGFGQMWQKTYRVRLSNAQATPSEVIATWKEHFSEFWPEGNRFFTPLTGIAPGEVGVIDMAVPGGMRLSTGVMVIYADDVSFTFMTPEGHMFGGWITFSAEESEGATEVQIQVLIRANDPIYELSFRLGIAHKLEDDFWQHTLGQLAAHFGVDGHVQQQVTLVDPKVQWSQAKNIWKNAGIRTALYMPVLAARRLFRR